MTKPPVPRIATYSLEQLFIDQERDWVIDTIAPVIAWVPGKSKRRKAQPFRFMVDFTSPRGLETVALDLSWDPARLEQLVPGVIAHAARLRSKQSAQREHVTELAAYALTFVAISVLMPGRRVVHMVVGSAPDMLFDVTPRALRGVETAGRSLGGRAAFSVVRDGVPPKGGKPGKAGKRAQLLARTDLAEVHLSLWCASPRIGTTEQLLP